MKKILLIISLFTLTSVFYSCGNKTTKVAKSDSTLVDSAKVDSTTSVDSTKTDSLPTVK